MDEFMNCSSLENYTAVNISLSDCEKGFYGRSSIYGPEVKILTTLCYALTFFVGLSGNSLVIYVVFRYSKMHTVTNFYILNLALSDELFLMGIPFTMVTQFYERWPFGNVMCKLFYTVVSINQFTSTLFLTIMSADRYIAVCQPINSTKFRTPMISKIVSLTAWTVSALMITPVLMYASAAEVEGAIHCNLFLPPIDGVPGQKIFTIYVFLLAFFIPYSLIFVFYTLVIHKLKTVGPKSRSKDKKKSHRKVTKLVLTVILVYAVCNSPYQSLQLALIFDAPKKSHSPFKTFLFVFCFCLVYINSAINPILYAFLSENFKKSFIRAFACIKRSETSCGALGAAENSAHPRRGGRDGALSSRSALCLTDAVTGDRSHVVPSSRDVSSTLTVSSRAPHSHDEHRNGHLLEVPGPFLEVSGPLLEVPGPLLEVSGPLLEVPGHGVHRSAD